MTARPVAEVSVAGMPPVDLPDLDLADLERAIAEHAPAAVALSDELRAHPELGWQETRSSALVAAWLVERGIRPRAASGTALVARLPSSMSGPTVALLGELDAVHLPSHPEAAEDGAAHACGHHASLAAACLAAAALRPVLGDLAGTVVVAAVPAEEMLPPPALAAARAGGVRHATGKVEMLAAGDLDDVDLALMVHTGREGGPRFSVGDTLRGAVAVTGHLAGQAAHGGSSPDLGVDAVRASRAAVDAIEAWGVAHPGAGVAATLRPPVAALGSVPAHCDVDVLLRADTLDDLDAGLDAVVTALTAAADDAGATLRWRSELAYAPTRTSSALDDVVAAAATAVLGPDVPQDRGRAIGASSDIGDLALVMPVSHPYSSGAAGHHHSPSYRVVDPERAVVEPARYLARAVHALLADGAAGAHHVLATTPTMSRAEYAAIRRRFARGDDR